MTRSQRRPNNVKTYKPMKTKKEQRKKQIKQTSKPHDLVPEKDVKGGYGFGGSVPNNPPPPPPVG